MIILSCNNLYKTFIEESILEGITFAINETDKVGVVGDNGSGKTTLFKILTNEISKDSGDISYIKNLKISILHQNISFQSEETVYNECLKIFENLIELEKEIHNLEIEMGNSNLNEDEMNKLFDIYEKKRHKFEENDGYSYNSKIRGVLFGLGFSESEFEKNVNTLSGGQKTRLNLAKILLEPADLILLDEPTNHLDLDSIQFLEGYLRDFKGSVMVISHDRYFLNAICNRIFSIERKKLNSYDCKYDEFVERKKANLEIDKKAYEKQQKEISRQKEIIERFENYGNKRFIKQASSRRKMLEKMDVMDNPEIYKNSMKLKLSPAVESGKDVLTTTNLTMGFGSKKLFDDLNLNVYKGDKIGIVGKNGVGKTTLFKLLLNELEPISGSSKLGSRVSIGYYDQEQKTLNNSNTIVDEFWDEYPKMNNFEVRSNLAKFNFTGEEIFKNVGSLSGGERARLELLKLMLSNSNFLLLDEPTNHLDIESKEVLEDAISDYTGTVLTISHDRYFLNKVVNKIWYLEDYSITEYYGNYDYFIEKLNENNKTEEVTVSKTELEKEKKKKREQQREEKQKKNKFKFLENEIFEVESKIDEINMELSNPDIYDDKDKMFSLHEELRELTSQKDELYLEWESYL